MADRDPDFVARVGEMIEYFISIRGLPIEDGKALSNAVQNEIRKEYEGVRVRVNRGQLDDCKYKAKIKAEFNGSNLDEIMERYGVSRATVYRIVKKGANKND